MSPWKIWVDTGGTFTDCIAYTPKGEVRRLKVLSHGVLKGTVVGKLNEYSLQIKIFWAVSQDIFHGFILRIGSTPKNYIIDRVELNTGLIYVSEPIQERITPGTPIEISSGEEVPVFAARLLTETKLMDTFPKIELKLGSTRGTNALLERKGARTALLITKGFRDLLEIGTQQRPHLFVLEIQKERPLYEFVIEVDERVEADGTILNPLTAATIDSISKEVAERRCESVAIALINSYKNPQHEQQLKQGLHKAGLKYVSISTEVSGQIKILPRAETVVANAYLSPIINQYVQRIQSKLTDTDFKIMTSAGGLLKANNFYPKDSLLSGPAGGVVGAANAAHLSGENRIITFDMGGTSTDVSLYNRAYSYRYESKVAAARILAPALAIETIAAGGGSICDFDGFKLIVGPQSAGAFPGPACYGSGGPLTITDVNLLLGRTNEQLFSIPLHREKSEAALESILEKIKLTTAKGPSRLAVLESFIQIANEKMAEAIRKVSIQEGHSPMDYSLLSFGGAGGQHACALAGLLGMRKIIIPYDAGLLSAYGIGHARIEHFEEQLLLQPFDKVNLKIKSLCKTLEKKGSKKLMMDGYKKSIIELTSCILFMRFKGQESTVEVSYKEGRSVVNQFRTNYKRIYGHWLADRSIEVESMRVVLSVRQKRQRVKKRVLKWYKPVDLHQAEIYVQGARRKADLFQWESLQPGAAIKGPALVVSRNSTTVVDPGWLFKLDSNNHAILTHTKQSDTFARHTDEAALELFSNRFTSVVQEMGALLQRTSFSVNVKERLDFSCAMMDAGGYLVVNAPHIPVHLGSMGVCVREVMKVLPMREGDVVITNHPAYGGSHLPDVTVIKPVFVNKKRIGFVAARAHHAEIGGIMPGSMPAHAHTLEEEGVIIAPRYLVKQGKALWGEMKQVLTQGKYPSRLPEENLADLNGALAAVNLGERELKRLCVQHTTKQVLHFMKALRAYASKLLVAKLAEVNTSYYQATEKLDDGSVLTVNIQAGDNRMCIDFTGSAKQHPGNLNATRAIVQSVILYVLRLWVNKPVAMNEGLLEHVEVVLPQGLLNPDFEVINPPAVVGGNTEISQRLTDTLLKALGLVACSQGTMNNFLFGNERLGFYETICGGTGAGPGFHGASAVHSHMTNTRITDPEILELRYPVRLERFVVRHGSGGEGEWRGGDGVIRSVVFKEKMEVNLLTQHRREQPYGMDGGSPGQKGHQHLITGADVIELQGMDSIQVKAGDKVEIFTPGGGGWGKKGRKDQ